MKKNTIFSLFILTFFAVININLYSQQCEVIAKNIVFESSNSLIFDVYLQNNGTSSWVFSHGSFVWNYDAAFLNGGSPTFTLVSGYSDFPSGAQPPSALLNSPNILRTSSNMPGSNGVISAGQRLRLQRFRLQTSASSFSGSYFNLTWKNSVVPYTRIFSWDGGTGLPTEISAPQLILAQPLLVENFEFSGDLTANGWTAHSGAGSNPINTTTGLTYTSYPGSGVGNAALLDNTGEDDNRQFTTQTSGFVYYSFLVNVMTGTQGYFIHLGNSNTSFASRVFVQPSATSGKINFGMSNSSSGTISYGTTDFDISTTYLVIVKYEVAAPTSTNSLWVLPLGIPATEAAAGTPEVATNVGTGLASITGIYLRQYSATQNITVDGIRIATAWEDLFTMPTGPTLSVLPSALSNFTYFVGAGPSASQSYSLSGTDLTPIPGNISVACSTNYEVSTDNLSFFSSVNVGYTSGTLSATPIYVRLKAGLPGGFYNNEIVTNAGGGDTVVVNCSGAVVKPEPSNHVTSFTGILGNPTYHFIDLSWLDATGATLPDGYLIKGSDVDFASITDPVDGTPVANSFLAQNVLQGLQTFAFGLNSGTPYFFKVYPYTNSGSVINYKTDGSIPQFTLATSAPPSLPITENFEYATGSNLSVNGWVVHSGAGTNPILVNATPLSYTGYVNSGLGKSVTLTNTGEDDNRAFSNVTSNSVYVSFMLNITTAQPTGDYIFHFAPENSTTLYFAKVFVKKNANDSLAFGVAKNVNSSVVYTPFNYILNSTYLIVVKYTFNSGSTADDEAKLWINPVLNGTEPAADVTQTDAGTDALTLGMFALRQGNISAEPASYIIGGLRVADTWIPGSSPTTFPLSVNVMDGWNMVSIPGLHPTDQDVDTWWSGRNLLADVYKWTTSYVPVSLATPSEGYWMLHTGANVYNTGDEYPAGGIQIVAHNSIPVLAGWNMIGGYDLSVPVGSLTTTPPGQIVAGTIYGWNGSYFNPANLEPGYGYWVLLSSNAVINFPTMADATPKAVVVEDNKEEWGKITLTDATGKSYVLYAVKGEVNLESYQLPPLPPAGMFDVRYGSGKKAEKLDKEMQTIEMRGITYPVKLRVEKTGIRIEDETGRIINERLKSGEEITITNSLVSKLKVSVDVIPDKYALEQNYPNPFNPSTKIEFSIPEDVNNVTLTIYNALGQRVAELINSKMEAGKYSYIWNASDVATGMYIYELRTDKFVSVKKMMLLK